MKKLLILILVLLSSIFSIYADDFIFQSQDNKFLLISENMPNYEIIKDLSKGSVITFSGYRYTLIDIQKKSIIFSTYVCPYQSHSKYWDIRSSPSICSSTFQEVKEAEWNAVYNYARNCDDRDSMQSKQRAWNYAYDVLLAYNEQCSISQSEIDKIKSDYETAYNSLLEEYKSQYDLKLQNQSLELEIQKVTVEDLESQIQVLKKVTAWDLFLKKINGFFERMQTIITTNSWSG